MAWLFFLLSGMTGLIYEVLWTRRLTLTFGHTVLAVSTVLTAFMGGLALGSLLGGRWSDRRRLVPGQSMLRDYGRLELFIGLWAAFSLLLLKLVEGVYLALATSGLSGMPLFLACFVLSVIALLPPTTAMGATLPVITQHLVESEADLGTKLSRLYGTNTVGALLGAALAGYVLLPFLGLRISVLLAAAVNVGIGVAAISRARPRLKIERKVREEEKTAAAGLGIFLPVCFALTGLASMTFQVAWTRALALSLGSSVYSFTTILVVFLAGLGAGSLVYGFFFARRRPTLAHLAWLQGWLGFAAALSVPLLSQLPWLFVRLFPYLENQFAKILAADVGLCALILLPPTLLLGAGFPLVTQIYAESKSGGLGSSIGSIYSANSLGCIIGSFLSGFVFVPQLGVQNTLLGASGLVLLVSSAVYLRCPEHRSSALLPLLLCLALPFMPAWDTGVMAGGVAVYAGRHPGENDVQLRRSLFRPPAFYRDGLSSTVSINVYKIDNLSYRVNGKADASLSVDDRITQVMLGWLPSLYQPKIDSACVIGLGSGYTLYALGQNRNVKEIHCVELEAAAVEANKFWAPYVQNILADPRVKVHVTDGRTYVLGSPRKFDAIVSEPSNPWIAGIGNMFTRDFYRTCLDHLTDDGVMCQWCNLYSLSLEDAKSVMRGFFDVFPYGEIYQSMPGDMILLGFKKPRQPDWGWMREQFATNVPLRNEGFSLRIYAAETLAGHYSAPREAVVPAVQAVPFNTDDRPILEFSAPLSLYSNVMQENFDFLRSLYRGDPPVKLELNELWKMLYGLVTLRDGGRLGQFLPQIPDSPHKDVLEMQALQLAGQDVRAYQEQAFQARPSASMGALLARRFLDEMTPQKAYDVLKKVATPIPDSVALDYWMVLAAACEGLNKHEEAVSAYAQAAKLTHWSSPLSFTAAQYSLLGKNKEVGEVLQAALARNPYDPLATVTMGLWRAEQKDYPGAIEWYDKTLQLIPDDLQALYCKHLALLSMGRTAEARKLLVQMLRIEPRDEQALDAIRKLPY